MSLKEVNGRLVSQPFVSGFSPSQEDAKTFAELFGNNTNVIQWVARMASYYQAERDEIVTPKAAAAPVAAAPAAAAARACSDSDEDLFGEETEEEKAANKAALEARKKLVEATNKKKVAVIAKSSILMDIKPWDDTTDLAELAKKLKEVEKDGLLWGDNKLVPVAFGLKKLQQLIVIEDDKVSGDDLEDIIMAFEDYVQSMDIVAWNKV